MMRTHKRGLRLILLLLIASMLVGICPGMAETVSDPEEVATEAPVLPGNPYRIVLIAPGGWTNNNGAEIKATVTDKESIGWQKIEYRMNGGAWTDCEDLFDQGKAEITVHENGTFMLRVTDPYDRTFDETAQVSTIDLELSGIAGVQINSMLFTTVEGNKLDVDLDDNMNKFEKLAVRAFDFAGNFSDPITLDNPDYVKPVDPTPEPTTTPKPSKKPGSSTSATEPPASSEPASDPTPTAVAVPAATEKPHGLGSSLIYVSDDDWMEPTQAPTAVPTAEPTAAPTPEPIIQTEYITQLRHRSPSSRLSTLPSARACRIRRMVIPIRWMCCTARLPTSSSSPFSPRPATPSTSSLTMTSRLMRKRRCMRPTS